MDQGDTVRREVGGQLDEEAQNDQASAQRFYLGLATVMTFNLIFLAAVSYHKIRGKKWQNEEIVEGRARAIADAPGNPRGDSRPASEHGGSVHSAMGAQESATGAGGSKAGSTRNAVGERRPQTENSLLLSKFGYNKRTGAIGAPNAGKPAEVLFNSSNIYEALIDQNSEDEQ